MIDRLFVHSALYLSLWGKCLSRRAGLQLYVSWSAIDLASVSLVLCRPAIMPFSLQGGPCSESACNVCNICIQGFRLAHRGQTAQRTGRNLRFGNGLYFSSVSGKANDYAVGSEKVRQQDSRVLNIHRYVGALQYFLNRKIVAPSELFGPACLSGVNGKMLSWGKCTSSSLEKEVYLS